MMQRVSSRLTRRFRLKQALFYKKRKVKLENLPVDVLKHVCSFLNVISLVHLSSLSKKLKEATHSDQIWFPLCKRLWKRRAEMPYSYRKATRTHFGSIILSYFAVQTLSLCDLQAILEDRMVMIHPEVTRHDLEAAILKTNPSQVLGYRHPFDHLWQASFVYSYLDSRRVLITEKELANLDWRLVLKHGTKEVYTVEFKTNNLLSWGLPGAPTRSQLQYTILEKDNRCFLSVIVFLALEVSRDHQTWGWVLQNHVWKIFSVHEKIKCRIP